jgi:hypothetical protein
MATDLPARGSRLLSDRLGMVIAQTYLSLTSTEPYRCVGPAKPHLARPTLGHLAARANFYSFLAIGSDGPVVDETLLPCP